jgi:hypothetical protein
MTAAPDRAVDAGAIHVGDELIVAVGLAIADAGIERTVRPVCGPDMHLRVEDQHVECLRERPATIAGCSVIRGGRPV